MIEKIERLAKLGLESGREYADIKKVKPIQGGSINEAYYVETTDAAFFMKFHENAPRNFFKTEATGLRLIKETNTINVPNFLAYSDKSENAFLLLEWIEGNKSADTEEMLGRKLAQFHQVHATMHGFQEDTYIGLLKQPNKLTSNWLEYYRDQRLQNQVDIGKEKGVLQTERLHKLETLLSKQDKWIPRSVEPSYLHGDLYSGNWIVGPGGEPFIVDPSILYGDRHFEMAYTELFGGFPENFYKAYEEVLPLREDYEDIKQIYQLYYWLAHLNLFGEIYGHEVDTILDRYV